MFLLLMNPHFVSKHLMVYDADYKRSMTSAQVHGESISKVGKGDCNTT